jgi:hypothetical protein
MSELSVYFNAVGEAGLSTTDAARVESVRTALGPATPHLVMVRELAAVLRNAGQALWAAQLDEFEEAHMVRVVFTD